MDPDLAPMIVTDLKEGTSSFSGSAVVVLTLGHVKHRSFFGCGTTVKQAVKLSTFFINRSVFLKHHLAVILVFAVGQPHAILVINWPRVDPGSTLPMLL